MKQSESNTRSTRAPRHASGPIRVTHLLDGRHFGGAEQMVRRLVERAPAHRIAASVYCLSQGRLATMLKQERLPFRCFPSSGRFDFKMLAALARAANEDEIQLFQAHTSRTHLLARILSQWTGRPNVTTIHAPIALDENVGRRAHPVRAWVERFGRYWTDHIVTVSREEAQRLQAQERTPPGKVTWIPNGVEPLEQPNWPARREHLLRWLNVRNRPEPRLIIAMVAQMRPRKGPEVLLWAFARWRQQGGPPATLFMIGDDEFTRGSGYLDTLKHMAAQLGILDSVCFTGFSPDPWTLAAGADLFVLPSLFGEGLPLVLLEAMNHELPVLASDTPGNRELIEPGLNGWLHPAGNARQLTAQLDEAARHPRRRRQYGRAGRQRLLEQYTLSGSLERYRQLYEQILS